MFKLKEGAEGRQPFEVEDPEVFESHVEVEGRGLTVSQTIYSPHIDVAKINLTYHISHK